LSKFNVDVTVVNPGFVETPMTASNDFPMPFLMQVDEAADCIIRGVARRKRKVNFPLRLTMTLKIAAMFPALWFGVIGPRLARREG
jgi:short-subunit dehydrogenase